MYGTKQPRIAPYNSHGNPECKRFDKVLYDLLKMLLKSQNPNLPAYLNSLVFPYNMTPNSIMGLQPYQLLFGHKAQIPCNNWVCLNNYDFCESVSKSSWLWEHHELMQAKNECTLESI